MSTVEDFKNAPIGATATRKATMIRAMKTGDSDRYWMTPFGSYLSDEEMAQWGYTLDQPTPTTAREALDLAWELAHPIREGQHIPAGTDYLLSRNGERPATMRANLDQFASKSDETSRRTLDPLPDPEPEWTKAPAVLASVNGHPWHSVWLPKHGGKWVCTCCGAILHWSAMADVTPPYPKETEK